MTADVLRVFWPSDAPRNRSEGVIVGWRNSTLDLFVVAVLQEVELQRVDNGLKVHTLFRNSQHSVLELFRLCGKSSLEILGVVNASTKLPSSDLTHIYAYTDLASPFPQIHCSSNEIGLSVQVVIFDRPDPTKMQYMSLNPISLALDNVSDFWDDTRTETMAEEEKKAKLVKKLCLHSVVQHPSTRKEKDLPMIITQINCSLELARLLEKNLHLISVRSKRSLSVSERVVESATTLWGFFLWGIWHIFSEWIYPIITQIFIFGIICHRFIAEAILLTLNWRLRPDGSALKDVSATAQQVDIRLQQFCYWPTQYAFLRKRRDNWESVTDRHPDYIRFYNSLWLVANDVIIGIALGSYIIDNAEWVALQINEALTQYTLSGLESRIVWLMGWPGGLKLNTDLAQFLGDFVLWVLDYWSSCIDSFRPILPQLVYFIGFSSFAGATMPIALFSDLLALLTLHIYSFYFASARIFHWQWTILISLFHLFRGKKHNVLRNRIDSCDYDLDQLLLGTILFTLLFFLLPTVIVFYLTFAAARMAIISLKATLDTLLAFLNHFPLFALMLRIKDSRRLPGGISFELRDTSSISSPRIVGRETPPTSYVVLTSIPLPLRAVFDQYFQLGQRIRRHYLSPGVVLSLGTGQFVPPIHRKNLYSLQYSALPEERASISEVWEQLNAKRPQHLNGTVKVPNGHNMRPRRTYR
ncbi:phosphatidylinositol N-acetylglucosaminyltransferase subunit gpi1 [Agyrium rufum]|nr:phosphatidylinositol N-acetylglucosaminyltransferase subunit gpi1 [Agyrium rufum]